MTPVYRRLQPFMLLPLFVLVFAGVRSVSAHAKLKSSSPAADSTVAAPERVVAVFANHDPLDASVSLLKVVDASGTQVDMGDSVLDPAATGDAAGRTLVVSLKPNLSDGLYTVNWEAGAADSVGEGSFQFTITAGAAPAAMVDAPVAAEEHAEAPATQVMPSTGMDMPSTILLGTAVLVMCAGLHLRRRAVR